jgi:hypothetical protein
MRKNVFKLIAFSLMIFFAVASCKKYEEGPSFTLLSVNKRLIGTWELKQANVNGNEININEFLNSALTFIPDTIDIDVDSISINYIRTKLNKDNTGLITFSGNVNMNGFNLPFNQSQQITWQLDDEKEKITVTVNNETLESEIIKLTKKELWLRNIESTNGETTITISKYEKIE